jgi:outer membrane receptor protein involved in Fe transport
MLGGRSALTGPQGGFTLEDVPAGSQVLEVLIGDRRQGMREVTVETAGTTRVDLAVPLSELAPSVVPVHGPSRSSEALVGAPVGASVVTQGELQRESGSSQLPKALGAQPGVRIPQSGMHDFNVNLRGSNEALNRRTLVLVDGRDASIPGLGAQEWLSFPMALDDLTRAELVRGPASALYGSNALNGVASFRSRELRDAEPGGRVRVAVGERDHLRFDLRHVAELGAGWRARFLGSYLRERDFSRDRTMQVEYPGPFWERVRRMTDTSESVRGGLRLDRQLTGGGRLSIEGGLADSDGWIATTSIGRLQVLDSHRSWLSLRHDSDRWSLTASQDSRDGDHFSMLTGQHLLLDGRRFEVGGEGRFGFAGSRGRLVLGGSLRRESAGSLDAEGRTTALRSSRADSASLFGRMEAEVAGALRFVLAARVDASDLHAVRLSPRVGFVWRPGDEQGVRVSYARGFRSPSLWESHLRLPDSGPVSLSDVEELLAPSLGGVPLHFDEIEVLNLGNPDLEVESADSIELGYTGRLGNRVMLSVDYHRSRIRDLVSALIPNVGTELGRLNPTYGPYRPPAELTPAQQRLVLDTLEAEVSSRLLSQLSNDLDARPILASLTYANVGNADTQGVDLGLTVVPAARWTIDVAYSWFEFRPRGGQEGEPLAANAPEHAATLAVGHVSGPFDATLTWRWVDGHSWSGGFLGQGLVPAYEVLDLNANVQVSDDLSLGLSVANALDHRHHEIYGGDVLGRRAIAHVAVRW